MTFEEAKKIFLNRGYIEVSGGIYYDADKWRESITVISKWLEQEPCDDVVSRRAVIDTLDKMDKALDDDRSVESYKELLTECYKDLTPVMPKERTGWIPVSTNELPKLYEEVIVTDIETSDTYVSRYVGNGYWECDNGLYQNRIIAWQPKPKPYKAESEVG